MTSAWHDDGQLPWLEEEGVELYRGVGRLTGEREVLVEGADGASTALVAAWAAVVLATGTSVVIPPVDGLRDLAPGTTAPSPRPRRSPGGSWCWAAGPSAARWPRRFAGWVPRRSPWSRRRTACWVREEPFAGEEVRDAFETEGITVVTGRPVHRGPRGRGRPGARHPGRRTRDRGGRDPRGGGPAAGHRHLGLDLVGLEPGHSVAVDDQLRAVGRARRVAVRRGRLQRTGAAHPHGQVPGPRRPT